MQNAKYILGLSVLAALTFLSSSEQIRTFEIDYENDTFLMDGEPFRYVSGSIHYFRVPHQYWKDRLRKIKLLGFNAISTYVEWFTHEPHKGVYNFEGDADVVKFIQLAQEEGLYVIARTGPYICAEREFGGYPAWLLMENPTMKFRTSDPSHTFFVNKWFQELFKRLSPLLYGNGGPIIMVQLENEYGSYTRIDKNYLIWLRDLVLSHVGDKAVLFTTDGWSKDMVTRGKIPGIFSTVDFGTTNSNVSKLFANLRQLQPNGPLVNSEFYTGWLSYWGEPMNKVGTQSVVNTMSELIKSNASFNCYMVHGGTNFGFTAGSGSSDIQKLSLTSYDYDAPITEAGDLTDKYMAIRKLLRDHGRSYGTDEEVEKLRFSPKGDYGTIHLDPKIPLMTSPIGSVQNRTTYPQTMEYFHQRYGIIAYTHIVQGSSLTKWVPRDPSVLSVTVRDRALVMLDNETISVLAYTLINETPLPPTMKAGSTLTLIVENEGRRNYRRLSDVTKGIVTNVTIDGTVLEGWDTVTYPLTPDDIGTIENLESSQASDGTSPWGTISFPMFFTAEFRLPPPKETVPGASESVEPPVHMSNEVVQNMVTPAALTAEVPESKTEMPLGGTTTNEEVPAATEVPVDDAIRRKREATPNDHPLDTFLDMRGWGKGIVWINGHNLGRYWHVGSQKTLYVPGVWLKPNPETNKITVLELHYTNPTRTISFSTIPVYEFPYPSVEHVS